MLTFSVNKSAASLIDVYQNITDRVRRKHPRWDTSNVLKSVHDQFYATITEHEYNDPYSSYKFSSDKVIARRKYANIAGADTDAFDRVDAVNDIDALADPYDFVPDLLDTLAFAHLDSVLSSGVLLDYAVTHGVDLSYSLADPRGLTASSAGEFVLPAPTPKHTRQELLLKLIVDKGFDPRDFDLDLLTKKLLQIGKKLRSEEEVVVYVEAQCPIAG